MSVVPRGIFSSTVNGYHVVEVFVAVERQLIRVFSFQLLANIKSDFGFSSIGQPLLQLSLHHF